ncbi:MAG: hypothetical protein Q8P59_04020, partial [Dehalococcoidia bacterium]|nr:hypothetical protein [Dehalococcoidia bacterium]
RRAGMSLVQKLVRLATGENMPEETVQLEEEVQGSRVAPKKASLVQRLAADHGGSPLPQVEKKILSDSRKTVAEVQKKATLVQKLASEFAIRPMGIPMRLGEARFENMEAAQKAVTKIYELTDKTLEDLQVTGQDLQQNNLDLAAQKVQDMADSIRGIKESFESDFPHLMKFSAPDSGTGEGTEAPPPEQAQPEAPQGEVGTPPPAPGGQAAPQMEAPPAGPPAVPAAPKAPGGF